MTTSPHSTRICRHRRGVGNWEDARRRIDLLALDKAGRLVVIELKRTDDSGHMELQAICYAAMVSSMGFAEVADAYSAHRAKHRPDAEGTAQAELAAFLDAGEGVEDPVISTDVQIMLRRTLPPGTRTLPRSVLKYSEARAATSL